MFNVRIYPVITTAQLVVSAIGNWVHAWDDKAKNFRPLTTVEMGITVDQGKKMINDEAKKIASKLNGCTFYRIGSDFYFTSNHSKWKPAETSHLINPDDIALIKQTNEVFVTFDNKIYLPPKVS